MTKKTEESFEQKLNRLTEIAETLGRGGVSLDDSMKLYKEAVKTAKKMQDELDLAEGKVVMMRKELDGFFTEGGVADDEFGKV